jgi:RNA polymerase sigma-70 factor, ECF subfamily
MTSDEDLMVACGRGSPEAFAELFGRYRQPVWGFFRRRVADRDRAEDLAQDVFVAVLNGARRYEPRAPFRAYLFGIAFRVLGAERRPGRRSMSTLDDSPWTSTSAPARGDDALWVRQALARLDENDRDVIMLREFEQLSYSEIGTLLGIPLNTVRSRLFRARRALQQLLEPAPERAGTAAQQASAAKG